LSSLTPYATAVKEVAAVRHPMRTARDCLLALKAQRPAAEWPGVYADAPVDRLNHFHHYYFEPAGPWEWSERASDADLFARLFIPAKQKPTIVWEPRYQSLIDRVHRRDAALFDEIARNESLPRATIQGIAKHSSSPMVPMREVLLVLPGRFGVCGR
jgi:hypothetical protein